MPRRINGHKLDAPAPAPPPEPQEDLTETKRDVFTLAAMIGLMFNGETHAPTLAEQSRRIADAVLANK